MQFDIRAAEPADAVGIAGVWAAVTPYLVKTARGIEAELRTSKTRVVRIATNQDQVVGYGNLWLPVTRGERVRISIQADLRLADYSAGFVAAFTGNDADNQPMLAVNRWLGYEHAGASWTAEKAL